MGHLEASNRAGTNVLRRSWKLNLGSRSRAVARRPMISRSRVSRSRVSSAASSKREFAYSIAAALAPNRASRSVRAAALSSAFRARTASFCLALSAAAAARSKRRVLAPKLERLTTTSPLLSDPRGHSPVRPQRFYPSTIRPVEREKAQRAIAAALIDVLDLQSIDRWSGATPGCTGPNLADLPTPVTSPTLPPKHPHPTRSPASPGWEAGLSLSSPWPR
jgi:hypothetical protein